MPACGVMRGIAVSAFAFASVVASPLPSGGSPWPMYRRSLHHDAAVAVQGPLVNGTAAWTAQAAGAVYGSPVLSSNGKVFIGSYQSSSQGTMYALDAATGASAWTFAAGGPIGSTPCLVEALGLLFFGADDGYVYALDAESGEEIWKYRHALYHKFQIASSLKYAQADDGVGRLFFGTLDAKGEIFALRIEGRNKPTVAWQFQTGRGNGVAGSPAMDGGELFVGANDGRLFAIAANTGDLLWTAQTNGIVYSSPSLSADGSRIFVGSNGGTLYAFNRSSGQQLWSLPTPGWVDSSPAVGPDGSVYVCISNGNGFDNHAAIYKVDGMTGQVLWQDELQGFTGLYDPVVAGSAVYAGSVFDDLSTGESGGDLRAWDAVTGARLWAMETAGHVGAAAAIDVSGALYIGDRMGKVFKVVDADGALVV